MQNGWGAWEDGPPPLVDGNGGAQAPQTHIPPPPGATMMPTPNGPAPPHTTPTGMMQYPWGTPFAGHSLSHPNPNDEGTAWRQYYNPPAYPQPPSGPGPSPYISRQPMYPEMPTHDPFAHYHHHKAYSTSYPTPSSTKQSSYFQKRSPWPTQGDLSPLDIPTRMPDVAPFAPRAFDMPTPASTLSRTISAGARIPPGMYPERPEQWRHDFKFKSGFASMLRSWSNPARTADDFVDSAKLDLHPYLHYSRSRSMTLYDLRREPLSLMFRALDRHPLASDMDHAVTRPPTQYMRLYHSRLPWYIDIKANGAPYISLADFFQQLFVALNRPISKYDFYNSELDDDDRDVVTRAFFARCQHKDEKMEGVKRVDFLRGKVEWMGLIPGKDGMWRLRTG